jgi:hypothetical protein
MKNMWRPRLKIAGVWLIALSLVAWMSAASTASDADYVTALAAADRFLQAWQSNDAETGIALLTAHAKKNANKDELERFFISAEPSAYEINRGKRLRRGRYEFAVALLTGESKKMHRKFSTIVIVNTGGNDWAIDKLP